MTSSKRKPTSSNEDLPSKRSKTKRTTKTEKSSQKKPKNSQVETKKPREFKFNYETDPPVTRSKNSALFIKKEEEKINVVQEPSLYVKREEKKITTQESNLPDVQNEIGLISTKVQEVRMEQEDHNKTSKVCIGTTVKLEPMLRDCVQSNQPITLPQVTFDNFSNIQSIVHFNFPQKSQLSHFDPQDFDLPPPHSTSVLPPSVVERVILPMASPFLVKTEVEEQEKSKINIIEETSNTETTCFNFKDSQIELPTIPTLTSNESPQLQSEESINVETLTNPCSPQQPIITEPISDDIIEMKPNVQRFWRDMEEPLCQPGDSTWIKTIANILRPFNPKIVEGVLMHMRLMQNYYDYQIQVMQEKSQTLRNNYEEKLGRCQENSQLIMSNYEEKVAGLQEKLERSQEDIQMHLKTIKSREIDNKKLKAAMAIMLGNDVC